MRPALTAASRGYHNCQSTKADAQISQVRSIVPSSNFTLSQPCPASYAWLTPYALGGHCNQTALFFACNNWFLMDSAYGTLPAPNAKIMMASGFQTINYPSEWRANAYPRASNRVWQYWHGQAVKTCGNWLNRSSSQSWCWAWVIFAV